MTDKVVHFEIPADDVNRASEFYKKAFDWKLNPIPEMSYTIIHTTEIDENNMAKEPGAINGGLMKRSQKIHNPVITINVDNMDESIEKVKEHGGELVADKVQVGDMGYSAYFKDTEGNILGLWQPIMKS